MRDTIEETLSEKLVFWLLVCGIKLLGKKQYLVYSNACIVTMHRFRNLCVLDKIAVVLYDNDRIVQRERVMLDMEEITSQDKMFALRAIGITNDSAQEKAAL